MVALSARTGKKRWTTKLPFRQIRRMHVTAKRIDVADSRRVGIAVLDTRTGKLLGTFGYRNRKTIRRALPSEL